MMIVLHCDIKSNITMKHVVNKYQAIYRSKRKVVEYMIEMLIRKITCVLLGKGGGNGGRVYITHYNRNYNEYFK